MHTDLEIGKLGYLNEKGELQELGSIKNIGVDFAEGKDKQIDTVVLTNKEITLDLKIVTKKIFHKSRKGKRYVHTYYEEISLFDDFFKAVLGKKNKKIKVSKLGGKQ